ncbi:unnamed protein product, partial [Brenthis ino]
MSTNRAGNSGRRPRRRSQENRRRTRSSYDSSGTSSTDSSVERANWRHNKIRKKDAGMSILNQLCNQVQVLTDFMNNMSQQTVQPEVNHPEANLIERSQSNDPDLLENNDDFVFQSLHTTLKDTGIGKTNDEHFNIINNLQHFGSNDWFNINLIETQKNYISKPGFIELETNDDLKPFDKNKFLPSCERTLSALSNAILIQRNMLQNNITKLLSWVHDLESVSYEDFSNKIKEIFCDDKEFNKISNDIMQIVCGKRASIIGNRRNELLKSVHNNFTVDKLKKIPPSSEFLFEPEQFDKLIEKEGGASKVFAKAQPVKKNYVASSKLPTFKPQVKNQLQSIRSLNSNIGSSSTKFQDCLFRGK